MWRRLIMAAILFSVTGATLAEEVRGHRWALLVGVNDYANCEDLRFCCADMQALRDELVAGGFAAERVFLLSDDAKEARYRPVKSNIERQLDLVLSLVKREDMVVIAFSGHGVHLDGASYWCPAEADLDNPGDTMVALDGVYKRLEASAASLRLMLVDACRNDPRPGGRKSLKPTKSTSDFSQTLEQPPQGILLLTSCGQGQVSMEEEQFGHGVFMNYLLAGLKGQADEDRDGQVTLRELWDYSSDNTQLYVAKRFNEFQQPKLKGEVTREAEQYPLRLALAAKSVVPLRPEPAPKATGKVVTNSIGMKFVTIPPGEFMMGSPATEEGRGGDELQHRVRITRAYELGIYEVTVGQFRQFVNATNHRTYSERQGGGVLGWVGGTTPLVGRPQFNWRNWWANQTDQHPVVNIASEDAVAFCTWLTRNEGRNYRLPTEAEWEYACRAGSSTRFPDGEDESTLQATANVADASAQRYNLGGTYAPWDDGDALTSVVGRFQPNAFGLYDMTGNTREFCADWYGQNYFATSPVDDPRGPASGEDRVVRGGGWLSYPLQCRSARRFHMKPPMRVNANVGFRIARDP